MSDNGNMEEINDLNTKRRLEGIFNIHETSGRTFSLGLSQDPGTLTAIITGTRQLTDEQMKKIAKGIREKHGTLSDEETAHFQDNQTFPFRLTERYEGANRDAVLAALKKFVAKKIKGKGPSQDDGPI